MEQETYYSLSFKLQLLTLVIAIVIGYWQYTINKRLVTLQDYVAIAAVPGSDGKIALLNTGGTNIYLYKIDLPGSIESYDFTSKPRLLAAKTLEKAYYWIDPPININQNEGFDFKIYLKDEFNNKWISEHGGKCIEKTITNNQDGTQQVKFTFKVWSYRTKKYAWRL